MSTILDQEVRDAWEKAVHPAREYKTRPDRFGPNKKLLDEVIDEFMSHLRAAVERNFDEFQAAYDGRDFRWNRDVWLERMHGLETTLVELIAEVWPSRYRPKGYQSLSSARPPTPEIKRARVEE